MPDLINTAISGLRLSQLSLSITGQNIVNADTEGYSRQTVRSNAAIPTYGGVGYLGNGVVVSEIHRNSELFLVNQRSNDLSVFNEFASYLTNINQVDNLLADPATSVSAAMDDFFAALNNAANNPTAIENRQLLLAQSDVLIDRFSSAQQNLQQQLIGINSQFSSIASNINNLSSQIAELNLAISTAPGAGQGVLPNDLLDSRDSLLSDLAEIVNVRTVQQPNHSVDVFIGEGQGLVLGPNPTKIVAVAGQHDPLRNELALELNSNQQIVTDQLSGGRLGGLNRFRSEALEPALNALGRITLALTHSLNVQQSLGADLDGELGSGLFTDINTRQLTFDRVLTDSGNALPQDRLISVEIQDFSQLTIDDYRLELPGPGLNYTLIRDRDNALIEQGVLTGNYPQTIEFDGLKINFESGSFTQGDSFLIRPTRSGVNNVEVLIDRPEAFAFALPIAASAGEGNRGNASLSVTGISDITAAAFADNPGVLSPPVLIRFNSPTNYDVLDYSDPAKPVSLVPPLNNQTFVPGVTRSIFSDDPGGTTIQALNVRTAVANLNSQDNGYVSETLSVTRIDPRSGFVSESAVIVNDNDSAKDIALKLNAVAGVTATASSQVQLFDFRSDGEGQTLNLSLDGELLTDRTLNVPGSNTLQVVPDPLTADFLRDRINSNEKLVAAGFVASSNGVQLTVKSIVGADIKFEVGGNGGDSFRLRDGINDTVRGRNALESVVAIPVNSFIEVDAGFGPTRINITPGTYSRSSFATELQKEVDKVFNEGEVAVTLNAANVIQLKTQSSRLDDLQVVSTSQDDPLGLQPLLISGPNLGEQPALSTPGVAINSAFDFSTVPGTFRLEVNGIYSQQITLNQSFAHSDAAAIAAAIDAQIQASTIATGIAGQVQVRVTDNGALEFITTDTGPNASLVVAAISGTQGIVTSGISRGAQLTGTQASVSGAVAATGGANFDVQDPHTFRLAVDGHPPLLIELTANSGLPAAFFNTADISAGADFSAPANSFDLLVSGLGTMTIDVSGVDTSLSADPFSSAPQGIARLFQERIDNTLGPGVVKVVVDASNRIGLETVATGAGVSITISNPTGNVATDVFTTVGTSVGRERGAAGVVDLIANAVNAELANAGLDPVKVSLNDSEQIVISSSLFGSNSQISISEVTGTYGLVFPGVSSGVNAVNSLTVGGTLDVQLAAETVLTSDINRGVFGEAPEAVSNFTGYQLSLGSGSSEAGAPASGDEFFVSYVAANSADNTNALAMVNINQQQLLAGGSLRLQEGYAQLIENVGVLTSQTRISEEASQSLLSQSEQALQSISGVNIDEEAALLIKLEQQYNASAQLVSIARALFNTILDLQ